MIVTRRTTLCAFLAGALALGSTHAAAAAGRHSPGAGEGGEPGSATTAQATGTAAARAIEDELVAVIDLQTGEYREATA